MSQINHLCLVLILFAFGVIVSDGRALEKNFNHDELRMHPNFNFKSHSIQKRAMPPLLFDSAKPEEDFSEYWNSIGQDILEQQLENKAHPNKNLAQNVIMFLGDGMSIPTIAATRVYLGGENKQLSFEKFPYTGLSKTYCANTQVADSACTATAYLGGIKGNYGTIGVSAAIEYNDCLAQKNTAHHVTSIAEWAQRRGMATGLITTTSVTHASPAGIYAHAANRNWENDAEVLATKNDPNACEDIASQLINGTVGRNLNVILGGGRTHFLPRSENDMNGMPGRRLDGRNLIEEWKQQHGPMAHYVQTKEELLKLHTTTKTHLMGLFAENHLPFHMDADLKMIPTLADMVSAALDILQRQNNGNGFFLFVEGGRIDHAHHNSEAMKALDETAEFDKAIKLALSRTSVQNTLTVVTSDHSHTMSIAGYSSRNNDIFGINNGQLGDDQLPYATLSYANGPGYTNNMNKEADATKRVNLRQINMKDKNFKFPAGVPLESETHGGDDVAVFASGPFSHLFSGVYEQNFIAHAMAYASCLGSKQTTCWDRLRGVMT